MSHLPLVESALRIRAYEQGKASSRVVKVRLEQTREIFESMRWSSRASKDIETG